MILAAGPRRAELPRGRWHTRSRCPGRQAAASGPDGMQRECMDTKEMVTVPTGPAVKAIVATLGPTASSILPESTWSSYEGHS